MWTELALIEFNIILNQRQMLNISLILLWRNPNRTCLIKLSNAENFAKNFCKSGQLKCYDSFMQRSFLRQLWVSTVWIGFLVLVIAYLPYLLKGFLIVSVVMALLALVGVLWFRWRFGAAIKSFREQSRAFEDILNTNPRFEENNDTSETDFTRANHRQGPVIHVKAQEVSSEESS